MDPSVLQLLELDHAGGPTQLCLQVREYFTSNSQTETSFGYTCKGYLAQLLVCEASMQEPPLRMTTLSKGSLEVKSTLLTQKRKANPQSEKPISEEKKGSYYLLSRSSLVSEHHIQRLQAGISVPASPHSHGKKKQRFFLFLWGKKLKSGFFFIQC